MFGYIKPCKSELLVKELEFYKALYCGLCDTIGHQVSRGLTLSLSYDFVFLALVRAMATDASFQAKPKRCAVHPTHKRPHVVSCDCLAYCARAALILTYENLSDDLRDKDGGRFRRLGVRLYRFWLGRARKKLFRREPAWQELAGEVALALEQISQLEKEKCPDLDRLCQAFGEVMQQILCFGLEGEALTVCREIGDCIGRIIYTADACDDLEKDQKNHSFNPLLSQYGSAQQARANCMQLDLVFSMYAARLDAALGLLPGQKDYRFIAHNVARKGIGELSRRVLRGPTQDEKEDSRL